MNAREVLLEQTRHRYRWLDRAVADVDAAAAALEVLPGRPTIAWQVAHLVHEVETTAEALCGAARPPEPPPAAWAPLLERWAAARAAALEGLATLTDADLVAAPLVAAHPGFEELLRTRSQWWSGHVFHLAYHLGQVGSTRAALGLGWDSFGADFPQGPSPGA